MRACLAALLLVACYSPSISDQQFRCSNNVCPSGFMCLCGVCRTPGSSCTDGGQPADMTMGKPNDGCSNGGGRAPNDPGLSDVAVCPAAWTASGILSTATPCGRQPQPDGKKGATDCTAEDNCAGGWHICNTETELMTRMFTRAQCNALSITSDFWVTRQPGAPPMPPGPPSCGEPGPRSLFGCGGFGNGTDPSCAILAKAVLETPMPGDQCAEATMQHWFCPGVEMTMTEASEVIKPTTAGGGVICCRN